MFCVEVERLSISWCWGWCAGQEMEVVAQLTSCAGDWGSHCHSRVSRVSEGTRSTSPAGRGQVSRPGERREVRVLLFVSLLGLMVQSEPAEECVEVSVGAGGVLIRLKISHRGQTQHQRVLQFSNWTTEIYLQSSFRALEI